MAKRREGFHLWQYAGFILLTVAVMLLCICAGSVAIPIGDTLAAIGNAFTGKPQPEGLAGSIIVTVRVPRVLCVALVGAALSITGAAMQGLLRNPLADGTTLGVSSGASLGAVLAIAMGFSIPGLPGSGIMVMSIAFAFLSMVLILSMAYKLDYSLSTNTIILIGVIFSMFASSMNSLLITFANEKVKTITFWTMGSLAGSTYTNVLTMLVTLLAGGTILLRYTRELNAFAVGEDNARHIGINVRQVKLLVLVAVSAIIGVSVSISGTIGFVGLVIPHITRMVTGPNHKRLLPATIFTGAIFLMLADLVSRVIFNPLELPIGVVTSITGSIVFIYIFHSTRKVR